MAAQVGTASGEQHRCAASSAFDVAGERGIARRAGNVFEQGPPLVGVQPANQRIGAVQRGIAVEHDHGYCSSLASFVWVLTRRVTRQVRLQPLSERRVMRDVSDALHGSVCVGRSARHGRRV